MRFVDQALVVEHWEFQNLRVLRCYDSNHARLLHIDILSVELLGIVL